MSRLLFAAARGARIQRQHFKDPAWLWEKARLLLLLDPETTDSDYVFWRIHPDDEHLQYGPISTALHKHAEDPFRSSDGIYPTPCNGQFWIALEDWMQWDVCTATLHRSLFLLILAEALADAGL